MYEINELSLFPISLAANEQAQQEKCSDWQIYFLSVLQLWE